MFQQVYCNPDKLAEIYERFPERKIQPKHRGLKIGDVFEFQADSIVYSIKVGERKVFPVDVARLGVKQATYGMAELTMEPISFVEFVGESNQGAINPLACPSLGCKFQATEIQELAKHIQRAHKLNKTGGLGAGTVDVEDGDAAAAGVVEGA